MIMSPNLELACIIGIGVFMSSASLLFLGMAAQTWLDWWRSL